MNVGNKVIYSLYTADMFVNFKKIKLSLLYAFKYSFLSRGL